MQDDELAYFRELLEAELAHLLDKAGEAVWTLMGAAAENASDPLDRATWDLFQNSAFRMHSRESRLIKKIRACLLAVEEGTYGICEDCGEPIDIERLRVRPVTSYCIVCKSRREAHEKAIGA